MQEWNVQVHAWDSPDPITDTTVRKVMTDQRLTPQPWSNNAGDTYEVHQHDYDKVLYVVRGSARFDFPEAEEHLEVKAGDRLDLPAGVPHSVVVGPEGVECLEARQPA